MKIKFTVRVKDCPMEFKEGMGEGVVAIQEVDFSKGRKYGSSALGSAIFHKTKELMDEYFEVTYEEVD